MCLAAGCKCVSFSEIFWEISLGRLEDYTWWSPYFAPFLQRIENFLKLQIVNLGKWAFSTILSWDEKSFEMT